MPRKTFAQGRAICLAMDRPRDDRGIISERPNDRMLVQKRQRLLCRRLMLQELPQGAKAVSAVRKGRFASIFQRCGRMLGRQRKQPLQHARAFDAACVQHRLRPLVDVVAHRLDLP
jgi:putative SOS response-associated peptidase YedK